MRRTWPAARACPHDPRCCGVPGRTHRPAAPKNAPARGYRAQHARPGRRARRNRTAGPGGGGKRRPQRARRAAPAARQWVRSPDLSSNPLRQARRDHRSPAFGHVYQSHPPATAHHRPRATTGHEPPPPANHHRPGATTGLRPPPASGHHRPPTATGAPRLMIIDRTPNRVMTSDLGRITRLRVQSKITYSARKQPGPGSRPTNVEVTPLGSDQAPSQQILR